MSPYDHVAERTALQQAACVEGANASRAGKTIHDNPHKESSDSDLWGCWRAGWRRPGFYIGGDCFEPAPVAPSSLPGRFYKDSKVVCTYPSGGVDEGTVGVITACYRMPYVYVKWEGESIGRRIHRKHIRRVED